MKANLFLFAFLFSFSLLGHGALFIVSEPYSTPRQDPFAPEYPRNPRIPPPDFRPSPSDGPLRITEVKVSATVEDQIALNQVDATLHNPSSRTVEGMLLFPVPKDSHIEHFSMKVGDQTLEAELLPADKAKSVYEEIVRKCKDPALLEYVGRDLYQVRIFPLEAGALRPIHLSYRQILPSENGLIQYSYPLRAANQKMEAGKQSIQLTIKSRVPINNIYSSTHSVEIKRPSNHEARVTWSSDGWNDSPNFELYYGTGKQGIGYHVLTYRPSDEEGYFLLLASPAMDTDPDTILPKDLVFVLDSSGSMSGEKLEQAKRALRFCVQSLNRADRFNVLRFSTDTETVFDGLHEATHKNRDTALAFLKQVDAHGGTAIAEALQRAVAQRNKKEAERPFYVIFLTDGRPTVGPRDETEILKLITKADKNAVPRIFCFGIGEDINTHLLDKIADTTQSVGEYVLPEEDIEIKVSNFYRRIAEPVLSDVELVTDGNVSFSKIHPSPLPDLFHGQQLVLSGRYSGSGTSIVKIRGRVRSTDTEFEEALSFPKRHLDNAFIGRLWATRRVGYLLDEIRLHGDNPELRGEITHIARHYGIVTPYTAYLIVEDEERRRIPLARQSLREVQENSAVRDLTRYSFEAQDQRSGGYAVRRSRSSLALKSANNAEVALREGNADAAAGVEALDLSGAVPPTQPRSTSPDSGLSLGRSAGPQISLAQPVAEQLLQVSQQARFVHGRTFYQNENQWIDASIADNPDEPLVEIEWGSEEFFDLLRKNPDIGPWLALGQNVQFRFDGQIYQVTAD